MIRTILAAVFLAIAIFVFFSEVLGFSLRKLLLLQSAGFRACGLQ